jgi:CarD family transcriptional regulator
VVFKGLSHLARKKALSFREKRMLDRAKFLLVSEIAEVERIAMPSVEERLDKALTKSETPRIKPVQKPVAPRRTSDA